MLTFIMTTCIMCGNYILAHAKMKHGALNGNSYAS